jgi:hypothetical protein
MIPYRLIVELLIGLTLVVGAATWYHHHNQEEEKRGEEKIKSVVAKEREEASKRFSARLASQEVLHEEEIRQIATSYADAWHGKPSVVCHSTASAGGVPTAPISDSPNGPAANGADGDAVHPDITGALLLFAKRLDELNADSRRLNELTH